MRPAQKYKWKDGEYSISELAIIAGMPKSKLAHRIKKNNGVVTERVMCRRRMRMNELNMTGEEKLLNDLLFGFTLRQISDETGYSYDQIKEQLNSGLTANQIMYGVFGIENNYMSVVEAWEFLFGNFSVNKSFVNSAF